MVNLVQPSQQHPPDIALLHRVLLTAPSEFDTLTVTGLPRESTLSFSDFVDQLDHKTALEWIMKRAFRDSVAGQLAAVKSLLLDLHEHIRQLIPNRPDLHPLLSDQDVQQVTQEEEDKTESRLPSLVQKAAMALQQLESPDRAASTMSWIQQQPDTRSHNITTIMLHTTNSLLYLLYKTELCKQDGANFYLQHVHAKQYTVEMEQHWYAVQKLDLHLTKCWIQSIPPPQVDETPIHWFKMAFIDTILFRSQEDSFLELPEIWRLDITYIDFMRETTKENTALYALELLCRQMAGVINVEEEDDDPYSDISRRRYDLNLTLSRRFSGNTEDWEQCVSDAVVNATEAMMKPTKKSLSPKDVESLNQRTKQILLGQDPTMPVVDKRMKNFFRKMVIQPTELDINGPNTSRRESLKRAMAIAKQTGHTVGLRYVTYELASAAELANRMTTLGWSVHHAFLQKQLQELQRPAP